MHVFPRMSAHEPLSHRPCVMLMQKQRISRTGRNGFARWAYLLEISRRFSRLRRILGFQMTAFIRFLLIAIGLTSLSLVPIYRGYDFSREAGDLIALSAGVAAGVIIILLSTMEKTFKGTLVAAALLSLMTLPAMAAVALYIRGPMLGLSEAESFPIFRSIVVFCVGAIILQAFGFTCYIKSFIRYVKEGPAYKRNPFYQAAE